MKTDLPPPGPRLRPPTLAGLRVGLATLAALAALAPGCRCSRTRPPLPSTPVAAIWAVGDGDDLERDDEAPPRLSPLWDGKTVRIFGAGNEILAFQIIVRAGQPGIRSLSASLPSLRHASGATIPYAAPGPDPSDFRGRSISLASINYLEVTKPTRADFIYGDGDDAPADPKGWKAVQIVPENARAGRGGFPLTVAPGDLQAIWIEIDTGRDRPPGIYRGEISVTADGASTTLPLELELFAFALPDESSLPTMAYYESDQPERYQGQNLDNVYQRFTRRYRIELVDAYDEERVRKTMERFDGRAFTAAEGYEGPGAGLGNRFIPATFYGPGEGWQDPATAWPRADAWMKLMAEFGPRVITFLYMPDEPKADVFPEIRALAATLRKNPGPGRALPTLVTHEFTEGLAGAIDIWCTAAPKLDLEVAARERKAGRQVWMYNGGRPHAPAIVIDAPASDARVIGWQAWKGEIPVYFYWHAVHWHHNHQKLGPRSQNVWKNPITFDARRSGDRGDFANGDGVLLYPGTERFHPEEDRGIEGPIASVQLANLRRGLQDHLYLSLARSRGHEALARRLADKIVPKAFKSASGKVGFPEETAPFEAARRELAQALAATSAKDEAATPPR